MPKIHPFVLHHLLPWLIAGAACVAIAWSPVGLAQTPPPPGVVWSPAVIPASSTTVVVAPVVDQNGLINARNARVQQINALYDRGVLHATDRITQTQGSLVEQFAKVRAALDTARLQASSGDAVQRVNASRTLDQANRLLGDSSTRAQQVRDSLTRDAAQALNSGQTIEAAEGVQQRSIATQAPTPATSASIAAFGVAQQRLQSLPAVTEQLVKNFEATIAVQQQDLRQRIAPVEQLLKTTGVH